MTSFALSLTVAVMALLLAASRYVVIGFSELGPASGAAARLLADKLDR
jgi:hypothetical protein